MCKICVADNVLNRLASYSTQVCMVMESASKTFLVFDKNVLIKVSKCVLWLYVRKHLHVCICMYVCMHVCLFVCVFVHMNTCICVCMYSMWPCVSFVWKSSTSKFSYIAEKPFYKKFISSRDRPVKSTEIRQGWKHERNYPMVQWRKRNTICGSTS